MDKKELDVLMSRKPDDIRKETKSQADQHQACWLTLSKNLRRIKILEDYKQWGFDTFEDYIEGELGLEWRTVRYHLAILEKLVVTLGVRESRLIGAQWSKLREIVPVVTKKNADSWIEKAEKLSRPLLIRAVKNTLEGKPEGAGPEPHVLLKFSVTEAENKTISVAMARAKKLSGSDDDGRNLELICGDFMSQHLEQKDDALINHLLRLEQQFHVKVLVVNKDEPEWKKKFEEARDIVRGAVRA